MDCANPDCEAAIQSRESPEEAVKLWNSRLEAQGVSGAPEPAVGSSEPSASGGAVQRPVGLEPAFPCSLVEANRRALGLPPQADLK